MEIGNLQLVKYPHPALRYPCKPLRRVDGELRRMVGRMLEVMYECKGIGLAASQVAVPYRLFVLNITGDPVQKDEEYVFINPLIKGSGPRVEAEEGCLSFPEIFAPVVRPARVEITSYNLEGKQIILKADGLFARAVQHENDHLDGITLVERASPSALHALKEMLACLEVEYSRERQSGRIPDDSLIASRLAELEALRT
jgi:peptide deformylase